MAVSVVSAVNAFGQLPNMKHTSGSGPDFLLLNKYPVRAGGLEKIDDCLKVCSRVSVA